MKRGLGEREMGLAPWNNAKRCRRHSTGEMGLAPGHPLNLRSRPQVLDALQEYIQLGWNKAKRCRRHSTGEMGMILLLNSYDIQFYHMV